MIALLNQNSRQLRIGLIIIGVIIAVLFFFGMPEILVQSSIRLATPYILGALAALIASRAGVLNLAIEGMMLLGSFIAVVMLYKTGLNPIFGVLGAMVSGGALGFVFAVLYLRIKINLVILALALNLFVANATVFFLRVSFGQFGTLADPSISSLPLINLPSGLLQSVPVLARLSGYNILVYLSWVLVFLVWLMLFRTRFGRHIRAVGENKEAAETVGINVTLVQIFALTISGALAGIAGSFLSIGVLSQFVEDMTSGRGWTAITVSLFAFEQPVAAFLTSLFFGLSESLSFYFQTQLKINLPPDLLLAIPQLATLLALILVALRIRAAELLKRRNFVAQFGQELKNLGKGIVRSEG
ncbi:MAG: ABC transporter permease [Chloroflexi bacterium]|nr:ABC transporter permease [Chloroflexota bacterium]MCC6892631.1 ABC transporter permease [Anaerolineae bacterium]